MSYLFEQTTREAAKEALKAAVGPTPDRAMILLAGLMGALWRIAVHLEEISDALDPAVGP